MDRPPVQQGPTSDEWDGTNRKSGCMIAEILKPCIDPLISPGAYQSKGRRIKAGQSYASKLIRLKI
jgi:hypothetical protein